MSNPNETNGGSSFRNELEEINIQTNRVQDQVNFFFFTNTIIFKKLNEMVELCC
jgi:hypothetical protein